jgi:hypothetical protein
MNNLRHVIERNPHRVNVLLPSLATLLCLVTPILGVILLIASSANLSVTHLIDGEFPAITMLNPTLANWTRRTHINPRAGVLEDHYSAAVQRSPEQSLGPR